MTTPPLDPSMFMEPVPTSREEALWTAFVEEYVKDYNPILACVRVGFQLSYAEAYAKQFLAKPFVQRMITARKNTAQVDDEGLAVPIFKASQRNRMQLHLERSVFLFGKMERGSTMHFGEQARPLTDEEAGVRILACRNER